LLSLFDILNVFYDNISVSIKAKMCQTGVNNSNNIIKCT